MSKSKIKLKENSNIEIRNSKQIQMTNIQNSKYGVRMNNRGVPVLNIYYSNFGFVSDFDIRTSDFLNYENIYSCIPHSQCNVYLLRFSQRAVRIRCSRGVGIFR